MRSLTKNLASCISVCSLSLLSFYAFAEPISSSNSINHIQLAHEGHHHGGGHGGQSFGWGSSSWGDIRHHRWKIHRICRHRCEDAHHFRHCFRNCLYDFY